MVLSANYIRSLPGDPECIEALAWLAENAPRYDTGKFTPPLRSKKRETEAPSILAVTFRLGRKTLRGGSAKVTRVDWSDGDSSWSNMGTTDHLCSTLSARILDASHHKYLLVTTGAKRAVLDVFLDSLGPGLLRLGYTLQPCLSSGGVSFIVIRKGRHKWTLVYLETASGASLDSTLALANIAVGEFANRERSARALYRATAAYSQWLLREFGVALQPTVGMTAMDAARVTLPYGLQKWRPVPLLVAMERLAYGYRGGMTYAKRYSGPTWRIDVTRQYTASLRKALPLRVAFGTWMPRIPKRPGVYVCRVQFENEVPYPIGVWQGKHGGFRLATVGSGSYVCVLHSSEWSGLRSAGARIVPSYGFTFTATFSLGAYVDKLKTIMERSGRGGAESVLSKPLGNYVYGKFGQRSKRIELMFSEKNPGKTWYPYWDESGTAWENIWERTVDRVTSTQHIDIAGTVTGYARSQTVSMWTYLQSMGIEVVRCHTDSLTVTGDPSAYLTGDGSGIGEWRLEREGVHGVIAGANVYLDDGVAHIAGVSEPTAEMIDRLMDGQVVPVVQTIRLPRRGMERGEAEQTRELRATAR